MNIQLEKALIIDQLRNINDADLIHSFQSFLNSNLKKNGKPASLSTQSETTHGRLTELGSYPRKFASWDERAQP